MSALLNQKMQLFKNKWLTCLEPTDRTKILKVFNTCISQQKKTATKKSSEENMTDTNRLSPDASLTKAELLMLHFFAEEEQDLQLLNRHPEIVVVFLLNTILLNYRP